MADFPEAGVKLVAETDDAQSAIDSLASDLDSLTSSAYTAEVEVVVDDSAAGDIPVGDTETTAAINVETDEESKTFLADLQSWAAHKVIDTIWNITGSAVDFLTSLPGKVLGPMLELDEAVARVNATTGNGIPNARELIHDIFYSDLGESIEQVADLVTTAYTIGAPVKDATTAVLTFTHAFTDQNPQTVLNTMNQMVVNKLTPDFKTAGDVLTVAFQNGANRGGDLLQSLNDNATAIRDLGLNAPQALSFIKTGLDAGFTSADQVLKALEKIKQNVTNAAGNQTSDVSKTLRILGIANPAETGEAWSAEFFEKVIEGIKNEPGLSDSEREVLFTNLIGGKQGGKVFSAFLQLSASDADKIFAEVGGASERAAAEADNHLKGAFEDFQLAVSLAVQNWLSSSAVDIPGKLAKLKEGLQAGLSSLAEDGDLGKALTVALKPIGFDDEFQTLEKALGDFVIGILQAVATLQDITGHGDQAAGTRATVEGLAKTQLAFDLSIANPDEIAAAVATATSRGLSAGEVTTQVSNMVQELVTTGTADTLAQAQTILDEFKKNAPNLQVAEALNGEQISIAAASLADGGDRLKSALETGIVVDVSPNLTPEHATALQEKIDAAFREAPPPDIINQLSESMGLQAQATERVSTTVTETTNPMLKLTDNTRELGRTTRDATPEVDDLSLAVSGVEIISGQASLALGGFIGFMQEVIDKAHAVSESAGNLATAQAAVDDANVTSSGGFGSGDGGGASIMEALLGYIAGGAFFGGGNVNNTINNNNSIPNTAVADALGYRQAATLRGAR